MKLARLPLKTALLVSILSMGCNLSPTSNINHDKLIIENTLKEINIQINGKVEWPKGFNLKATTETIVSYGTVSLLYPHDHPSTPNRTIATGLTDESGNFKINPQFIPQKNETYLLEVNKRIGGVNNEMISLRTFVKWDGSVWLSMTSGQIVINPTTTALAIISDHKDIAASSTINTITSNTIPSDINFPVSLRLVWIGSDYQSYIGRPGQKASRISDISSKKPFLSTTQVKLSPNGKKVVWSVLNNDDKWELYIRDADRSNNPVKLPYDNDSSPFFTFSDDGNKLSIEENDIKIINVDGSGTPVYFGINFIPPNAPLGFVEKSFKGFSSDNQKILWVEAYVSPYGNQYSRIYQQNVDGSGSPIQIKANETGDYYIRPMFSHDGKKIAFLYWNGINYDLFVNNSDGSNSVKIATGLTDGSILQFSKDNSSIFWESYENEKFNIFKSSVDGNGTIQQISSGEGDNRFVLITPDDKKIVWVNKESFNGPYKIFIKDIDTNNSPQFITERNDISFYNIDYIQENKLIFTDGFLDVFNTYVVNIENGLTTKFKDAFSISGSNPRGTPQSVIESGQGMSDFLPAQEINTLTEIVKYALSRNRDPIKNITYDGNNYSCFSCDSTDISGTAE